MKIINREQYNYDFNDCIYKGRIELTKVEFDYIVNHIFANKDVSDCFQGAGKYPYLSKDLLKEDIAKGKNGIYSLRCSFSDYVVNRFKNQSKFNYKKQNYLIKII